MQHEIEEHLMTVNSGSTQPRQYTNPESAAEAFADKFRTDTMQIEFIEARKYGMPTGGTMQILFTDLSQDNDVDVIKVVIAHFEQPTGGFRILPIKKVEVDRSGDLGPDIAVVTLTVDQSRLTETMPLPVPVSA